MPLTDQLVLIVFRRELRDEALAALAQLRMSNGLVLRDAAVLLCHQGTVAVCVPDDDWPDRRRLSHRWWTALARTVADFPDRYSRALIDGGVSRSFLEEVAAAVASEGTAVALLATQVEIEFLRPGGGGPPCAQVIYGFLPESAIDDLYELTA